MSPTEFVTQLCQLTDQPNSAALRQRPVHVLVNNADYRHRPSAAVIELAGVPPFAILVSNLQSPYRSWTLVIGRNVWREGDTSERKQQLAALIDEFLDSLGVKRDKVLPKLFRYVGK
jgi:hypothetical protein